MHIIPQVHTRLAQLHYHEPTDLAYEKLNRPKRLTRLLQLISICANF